MADQSGSQGSNEPLSVDTSKLQPAVAQLLTLASQLKSAGDDLEAVSQSYGQPWGDDKTGKQFYGQYGDPHGQLITAALQGGQGLQTASDQVADLIRVFEQVEEQAGSMGLQLKSNMNQNP